MSGFVFLSGPSCVGKGPLWNAVKRFHPDIATQTQRVVLYTSRLPRPGEVDGKEYHFRTAEQIGELDLRNHIVFSVRSDRQAINVDEVRAIANGHGTGLLECYHALIPELKSHRGLIGVDIRTVFVSPVTLTEFRSIAAGSLDGGKSELTALMLKKLNARTMAQEGVLSAATEAKNRERAESAYGELCNAHTFDYVIPNHDGEDSPNWTTVVGDAQKTLNSFVAILRGAAPEYFENWNS